MADVVVVDIVMRRGKLSEKGDLTSTTDPFLDLQVRLYKNKLPPYPWGEDVNEIAGYYVSLLRDDAYQTEPPEEAKEGVHYSVKTIREDVYRG